jgi:hypothetical protein
MADLNELSDAIRDQLPEGFSVAVANLSEEGQQQIIDALQDPAYDGNADSALLQAQQADGHRENVEELHKEQAEAISEGDFSKANDIAHATEYEVRAVEGDGGAGDAQLATAWKDEDHTSDANWHAETAAQDLDTAASYASTGDTAAAATLVDHAGGEAAVAADAGASAAQGGVDASHDYSSAASVSETSE